MIIDEYRKFELLRAIRAIKSRDIEVIPSIEPDIYFTDWFIVKAHSWIKELNPMELISLGNQIRS